MEGAEAALSVFDSYWRRLLLVGDPHVTPDAIQDCDALLGLVLETATARGVPVLFLGDQYHSHAIVHLAVMEFWIRWLDRFQERQIPVAMLRGNHDQPTDGQQLLSALRTHRRQALVIERTMSLGGWLYVPYQADAEAFLAELRKDPDAPVAVCHQAFNGSMYENGIYVKDGVDPNLAPQKMLISGHIHGPQEFGKVWHPGAPRWRTTSDANVSRAVWIVTREGVTKQVVGREPVDTGGVCKQIKHFDDTPEAPMDLGELGQGNDLRASVRGPEEWCRERAHQLRAAGVKVRTFPVRAASPAVRESDGIPTAFAKFAAAHKPKRGTSMDRLTQLAGERIRGAA